MKKLCVNRVSKRLLVALLTFAVLATMLFSMPVYAAENSGTSSNISGEGITLYDAPIAVQADATFGQAVPLGSVFSTGNNNRIVIGINCTNYGAGATKLYVKLEKQTIFGFLPEGNAQSAAIDGKNHLLFEGHPVDKNTNYRITCWTDAGYTHAFGTHGVYLVG